jgi:hypothetical protein
MERGDEDNDDFTSDEDNDNTSDEDRDHHSDVEDSEQLRCRIRDQLICKIEGNDPTVIEQIIHERKLFGESPQSFLVDWERLGNAIGNNTQLREITFSHFGVHGATETEHMLKFLRGVALNRSIQKLSLFRCNIPDEKFWDAIALFFMQNQSLENLELMSCTGRGMSHPALALTLHKFHTLKKFAIDANHHRGGDVGGVGIIPDGAIQALIGHSGLVQLSLLDVNIGNACCAEIAALLQNPTSNLKTLHLMKMHFQNVEWWDNSLTIIGDGLASNSSLIELELDLSSAMGEEGILTGLERSMCMLERLVVKNLFARYEEGSYNVELLSSALESHVTTLMALELSFDHDGNEPNINWMPIFNIVGQRNCVLEELNLDLSFINNAGMAALTTALANNNRLRELVLCGNFNSVTRAGWMTFLMVLFNLDSSLEVLEMNSVHINDKVAAVLSYALTNNNRLRILRVCARSLTPTGFMAFSTLLRNPSSTLERLDLRGSRVNDQVMISFANALTNNRRLRELDLSLGSDITSDGYTAFTNTLGNRSSIMETYQSNHTLEKLCSQYDVIMKLPKDLTSLLLLNKKKICDSQAARLKIIMMHFSGSKISMLPFVNMDLIVRPHAIAWMFRDLHSYELLRAMPSLLEKYNMKEESDRREEAYRREEVNCMRMELSTIHERNPAAFARLTAEIVEAAANRKRGDVPPLENPSIEQRKRHKEGGGVDE